MTKTISKIWTFASSSGGKPYETIQYSDSSTSCQCKGWTRHFAEDGSRSCKHTKAIEQGKADSMSIKCRDEYGNPSSQRPLPDVTEQEIDELFVPKKPKSQPKPPVAVKSGIPVVTKIVW